MRRANVEAARDAGFNPTFLSGNEVNWRTRWEPSIDGTGAPYRTLVSYKETYSGKELDPTIEWTGTWRDPRWTPPNIGGGRFRCLFRPLPAPLRQPPHRCKHQHQRLRRRGNLVSQP